MSEAVPSAQRAAGARRARPHDGWGGTTRVVEGVVLVLAGILLATATIHFGLAL